MLKVPSRGCLEWEVHWNEPVGDGSACMLTPQLSPRRCEDQPGPCRCLDSMFTVLEVSYAPCRLGEWAEAVWCACRSKNAVVPSGPGEHAFPHGWNTVAAKAY